jgi:uncharacterized protein YjbJ (UPF0337 family)
MGILDKITGRAKRAAGNLTDDASMRRQGNLARSSQLRELP